MNRLRAVEVVLEGNAWVQCPNCAGKLFSARQRCQVCWGLTYLPVERHMRAYHALGLKFPTLLESFGLVQPLPPQAPQSFRLEDFSLSVKEYAASDSIVTNALHFRWRSSRRESRLRKRRRQQRGRR